MKFGKQFQKFIQIFILSCSECIGKRCVGLMIHCPPKPYLMFFVMIKAPHFVHFHRFFYVNIYICRFFIFYCFKELFIYLFREIFCFFKTDVTVLGEIFNTRPVSLVPEPFIAISIIFSFVSGLLALLLYSN